MGRDAVGRKANNDFKRSILQLFIATIVTFLGVFLVSTYHWQNARLDDDLNGLSQAAGKVYQEAVHQDTQMLGATLTALLTNDSLRTAFAKQDRDSLLKQSMPLFERLRKERQITHFYFIRPDRTVLLRVHMPARMGDVINRVTMLQAEKTQAISQGVELGLVGTFTLRVVSPWIEDGKLLGYVELGKEIDNISTTVQNDLSVRSELLIDKTLLRRDDWESGMSMLGRPAQWDLFDHWVLNGSGLGPLPVEVKTFLNAWHPGQNSNSRYEAEDSRHLLLAAIALHDAAQRPVGALVIQTDVTDKVHHLWRSMLLVSLICLLGGLTVSAVFWLILIRIERQHGHTEEKLRAMFQMSPFGMALNRLDGLFVEVNPAFAAMLGYSPPDLINKTAESLLAGRYQEDNRRFTETLKLYRRAGPITVEFHHRDGHTVPVSLNGMLISGSDGQRYVWSLVEDISERLNAERLLNQKSEELARSNAELEAFAYATSHDLRQPLRSIGSYVSLLERQYSGRLDEEGREFMHYITDGVRRMDRLIIDVLDYARIGRLSKPMEAIPLSDVAGEVAVNLKAALDDCRGLLTVDPELPTVWGEHTDITRLLQNLVNNALKFHAPERPPVVCVRAENRADDVLVTVEDNGIGIKPSDCEKIFGIFQRLHSREQYDGTGIGLAVCKKIVEHHGGRIWVEHAQPYGSRFCFTLKHPPSDTAGSKLSAA